jgi:hypothetical protein
MADSQVRFSLIESPRRVDRAGLSPSWSLEQRAPLIGRRDRGFTPIAAPIAAGVLFALILLPLHVYQASYRP